MYFLQTINKVVKEGEPLSLALEVRHSGACDLTGVTVSVVIPQGLRRVSTSPTKVATANSGLSESFTVVSGPATVVGDLLTLTGEGKVIVRAEQAGDEQFLPAPPVQREITVLAAPTPLRLSEVSMVPEGRLRFRMKGPTGGRVILQFSPDLRAWIAVSTNTVPMALELPAISDQDAGFYRMVLP